MTQLFNPQSWRHAFVLFTALVLLLPWSNAQKLDYVSRSIRLDASMARSMDVILPTLAFLGDCGEKANDYLAAKDQELVRTHYENTSDEIRMHLVQIDLCWVVVDISRAEAHRIISEIVSEMDRMKILNLRQSYWGTTYSNLEVISSPDVFSTSFMAAEEHNAEVTVNALHFGHIVFKYSPTSARLHILVDRHSYSPGL